MSEYGKAKSWTKVSTAGRGMFFQSMEYGDGLFFFDRRRLPIRFQDLEMFLMIEYTESLISFHGTKFPSLQAE